ncbi:MAG TPA: restriction endonuclease subunit S, partial [Methylomirabilota bacterium]|nr:restriction endonuclease subunit S [Methylomirabilota bacterium]
AYKHILRQNTIHGLGDQLTPEEKTKLMQHFVGYDISPDMVKLSLVNMYLHSFPNPNVFEYDTLTNEERWDETFDVIMANPPFMSPKGGIRPHKRFSIQANRSEVLFVDYIAEHLTIHGRAGVIVPEGIIFQSGNAYKALRKMLVEKYVWAVVSLPSGVFQPYSGVKTSILLMDKTLAKKAESILFVKVENDGFDLGAQRRAIEKNDLTQALVVLQQYKQALQKGEDISINLNDSEVANMAVIAKKAQIAKNGDYNLSGERYRENLTKFDHVWPMVELGEICNFINGRAFKPSDWEKEENGGMPIIRIQNLNNPSAEFNYYSEEVEEKLIIKNGDLLFSWSGSKGTSFGSHIWRGSNGILNQHIFKVEHSELVTRHFLYYMLRRAVVEVEQNLHGGVGLVHITKGNLERIKIPLPSLEAQKEIVTELENYQKIIDGAKQVVENYKAAIIIDPNWEMVEVDSICNLVRGSSPRPKGDPRYYGGNVPRLMISDVTRDGMYTTPTTDSLTEEGAKLSRYMKKGEVIMAVSGNPGLPTILRVDACIHDGFVGFRDLDARVLPEFLYYLLFHYKEANNSNSIGAVFKNLTTDQIKE